MKDPDPIGDTVEDVVEETVSSASPLEDTKDDGGTDEAGRDGHAAVDDENFTA